MLARRYARIAEIWRRSHHKRWYARRCKVDTLHIWMLAQDTGPMIAQAEPGTLISTSRPMQDRRFDKFQQRFPAKAVTYTREAQQRPT